jgi:hypothetical protein
MEKTAVQKLKKILLAGFVLLSVVLILSLWTNNLLNHDDQLPGFYRSTSTPDVLLQLTATPIDGQTGQQNPLSPTPAAELTPTPTVVEPTEPVDQVN